MQKTAKQTTKMKEGIVMKPQIIKKFSEETGHKMRVWCDIAEN